MVNPKNNSKMRGMKVRLFHELLFWFWFIIGKSWPKSFDHLSGRILMTLRNYFCMRKNPSSGSHYHSINIWMLINGIACLVHKNINDMTLKLFLDGIINQRIEMCLVLGLSNLRSSEFSFPRLSSREVLALLSWEKKSLARGWWCTKGKGKVNRCWSKLITALWIRSKERT